MPVLKEDVLFVLGDSRLHAMRFKLGPIQVNAEEYDKVANLIAIDAIRIQPTNERFSAYIPQANTLKTRSGDARSDWQVRTNVLHECTHIICDINEYDVTRLTDEAGAYLAQIAYLLLLDPAQPEPPIGGPPIYNVMRQCMKLVEKYKIGDAGGKNAVISQDDIDTLTSLIRLVPDYSGLGIKEKLKADGVALSNAQAMELITRMVNRDMDESMRKDTQDLLYGGYKSVAYENNVTNDDELHSLFNVYTRGGLEQKKTTKARVLRLFLTISPSSAATLWRRLSATRKADSLSARFQSVFLPLDKAALIAALQMPR